MLRPRRGSGEIMPRHASRRRRLHRSIALIVPLAILAVSATPALSVPSPGTPAPNAEGWVGEIKVYSKGSSSSPGKTASWDTSQYFITGNPGRAAIESFSTSTSLLQLCSTGPPTDLIQEYRTNGTGIGNTPLEVRNGSIYTGWHVADQPRVAGELRSFYCGGRASGGIATPHTDFLSTSTYGSCGPTGLNAEANTYGTMAVPPNTQSFDFSRSCEGRRVTGDAVFATHTIIQYRAKRADCNLAVDSDRDGVGDCAEYDAGTDPLNGNPAAAPTAPPTTTGPPATGEPAPRLSRGKNPILTTANPSKTSETLKILKDVIKSVANWKKALANRNKAPYNQMDFGEDGCSQPGWTKPIPQFGFEKACIRHDFLYRNALWMGVFNEYKAESDAAFRKELMAICAKKPLLVENRCRQQATAFVAAVRSAGGKSVPKVTKSWKSTVSVSLYSVFQPIGNFYIRGVLTDLKADGKSVRLQVSADQQAGADPDFETVARSNKGKGVPVYVDYSFNGIQGLRAIKYQICVDSNRPDAEECSPVYRIQKP